MNDRLISGSIDTFFSDKLRNKKVVAFFDFDGTITYKDTFIEFIKYYRGPLSFIMGMALLSPVLILFKIGIIKNWKAKEIVLAYFFGGEDIHDFKKKCDDYSILEMPKIMKEKALSQIRVHQENGHELFVVSASPTAWLAKWCREMNLNLISSNLEIKNNKLTGKLLGKNCYGIEKVNRIKEKINILDYDFIFAYGDSKGDKQMLEMADYSFYRSF